MPSRNTAPPSPKSGSIVSCHEPASPSETVNTTRVRDAKFLPVPHIPPVTFCQLLITFSVQYPASSPGDCCMSESKLSRYFLAVSKLPAVAGRVVYVTIEPASADDTTVHNTSSAVAANVCRIMGRPPSQRREKPRPEPSRNRT